MPKIHHVGNWAHRTEQNPLEAIFSEKWAEENNPPRRVNGGHGVTELSLCSDGNGRIIRGLTQAEATAAATVIQWLGSPVGFCWLRGILVQAGYRITEKFALLRGAAKADDERLRAAAIRAGISYVGCDTPDALADKLDALKAEVERLTRERDGTSKAAVQDCAKLCRQQIGGGGCLRAIRRAYPDVFKEEE